MSIEQKLCKVKIFQLQSMSNAKRCIDQRFAFKNSGISCLENDNPARKKAVAGCETFSNNIPFFSSDRHEIIA